MLYLSSVRVAPGVRSALAVACGVMSAGVGMAQEQSAVEPVVVTASRIPQLLQTAPIGATVITAEQIQRSGVADANEAIRKLGGVVGKSDLYGGREYTLDLRGYGDAASSNLVVLVDGMRISENELRSARMTAISLDQIDRIEIVRGGSSALWGEGATAGVINIILKKTASNRIRLTTSVESYGGNDVSVSASQQVGAFAVDGDVNRVRSEGYRDHATYKQDSGSFGLGFGGAGWYQRFRVQQEASSSLFPDALTFEQFEANPRQSVANVASGVRDNEMRFSSNTEIKLGEITGLLDFATRRRQYRSSTYGRLVQSAQVAPKLTYTSKLDVGEIASVVGVDLQRWRLDVPAEYGGELQHQSNSAVFMNHSLTLPTSTRVDVGYRRERIIKRDDTSFSQFDQRSDLDASEVGLSQQLDAALSVYGRLARSYRLGNLDENGYVPPGNGPLRPQKSRDKEVGVKWMTATQLLNLRFFRQDNVDEIMYAPSPIDGLSYNLNADPTERRGIELEGRWALTNALELRGTWQRLSARYRSGPNQGKDMVLVAPQTSTMRATYKLDSRQAVEVGVQYRSKMRFSDDNDNTCARRIPASTQFDARYSWTNRDWTFALTGTNLGDQVGYNYAYSCTSGLLYPEIGRALKASVSRTF